MSLHGNNPINFITFNQALPQNKTLGQNITFCFFIYKQYIVAFVNFQDPYANLHSQQRNPNKLKHGGVVSTMQLEPI